MKITFWDNSLSERGTTISLYNYAYYNKYLLGNESIIMYDLNNPNNDENVIKKFKKEFLVFGFKNFYMVDKVLEKINSNMF
jgi:hypothetical protein